ncbi:MAG TPA: AraC family transcriptional regulator [Bdellovibrionota bacterium]|jgi:AraC family transcriptional regulator|nr:AraC family transcriptional regulator [Bdellovibrionota bacterium]
MLRANPEYTQRIDRVIDYLRENLDRPVKLAELARVACFSEFHFHRIFSAVTGESVNAFTLRLRIEKAARLLRLGKRTLTEIAFECGFSSSATFSRAFRAAYDLTPSEFRKTGHIKKSKIRKALQTGQEYVLPMSAAEKKAAFPVRFVDLPKREVAYLRVTDTSDMDRVIAGFQTVIDWAKAQGVWDGGILFGMTLDDVDVTPAHLFRYEVCLATAEPFKLAKRMGKQTLPPVRYAAIRVSGDLRRVATAWDYLIREWLISSPFEPEHAPALEIFLDKEKATDWSHFELDLCLPIKQLEKTGA